MTTGSTAGSGEAEALGPGTYFSGAAESAARHLLRAAWLPDHDLSGLGKDYGLDLSSEAPICQKDASGRFTTAPLIRPYPRSRCPFSSTFGSTMDTHP